MSDTFVCEVCGETFPKELLEVHHLIQQAAGGSNKPTVNICQSCHNAIHLLTSKMINAKSAYKIQTILDVQYGDNNIAKNIAINFATIAYRSLLEKREGNPEFQPETSVLSAEVSAEIKNKFQLMAKESRQSMESLLRNLILTAVNNYHG